MSQDEDYEITTDEQPKDTKTETKTKPKGIPLREVILNTEEGEEGEEGEGAGPDIFSTPVARVRSLKDNRNAIFVATVTRSSEEDWDTLFEKERLREQLLREQFAEQRLQEEEEEKKAKVEEEKKQLPMIDQSKIGIGSMGEVVNEITKLVGEGEKLTDAVAEGFQTNNNQAYALAAREIIRRASPFHLVALVAAALEAEKLGLAIQQALAQGQTVDATVLESRVDHILSIANQFDRLQTFLNKQQKLTQHLSTPTTTTTTATTASTSTPATTTTSIPTTTKAPTSSLATTTTTAKPISNS